MSKLTTPLFTFLFCLLSSGLSAQRSVVETEISSDRIYELSVIRVYPDSFPSVSVVFQAKNKAGKPLWLLKKEELEIKENGQECNVLRVIPISKDKPLNLAMILDHSGSMVVDPSVADDTISYEELYYLGQLPAGYKMPIDYAKKAIFDFCSGLEANGDSMLFVTFNHEVDKIAPLTSDFKSVQEMIKGVQPGGSTAFYDALYYAVDSLAAHHSQPVIIALTDGMDNHSTHRLEETIRHAIDNGVSIYIVGLGGADSQVLDHIAAKTKGFYYYTNDPSSLAAIYANIKEQLKSIYRVDYVSADLNAESATDDSMHVFQFFMKNDTVQFADNATLYKLPAEAFQYIKEQDELRKTKEAEAVEQKKRDELLLYGSFAGGGALLIGFATFLVVRRTRRNKLQLKNAFPNPFTGPLNIEYNIPQETVKAMIRITNPKGQLAFKQELTLLTTGTDLQLSDLKNGIYLMQIETESGRSNTIKIVKSS
ncbi:MAG: VWA domain-containing protein [Bacteroidia bacterium]